MKALKDQFNDDKQKVEQVAKRCEQLTTPTAASHDLTNDPSSVATGPGGYDTPVDVVESSVDATPPATAQGEGLKELQEAVKSLENKCAEVEDKLKEKGVALADRKTAVESYDEKFKKFDSELDHVSEELNKSQPVLNDDDAVKEQIKRTEVGSHCCIVCELLLSRVNNTSCYHQQVIS